MNKYIHYGSTKFDPNKFVKVKNGRNYIRNKPEKGTGLWASPLNSSYGWKDWCYEEGFRKCEESNSFVFTLKESAKVLTIDKKEDLIGLPTCSTRYGIQLDFEKLSKEFDAILLTEEGQYRTRHGHPINLYGWDCECILVLNNVIKI